MRLEHSCEEEMTTGLELHFVLLVKVRTSNLIAIAGQILSLHNHLITENGYRKSDVTNPKSPV